MIPFFYWIFNPYILNLQLNPYAAIVNVYISFKREFYGMLNSLFIYMVGMVTRLLATCCQPFPA